MVAFVAVQVVDAVFPYVPLPDRAGTLVILVLAIGFPITVVLAWTLEWTSQGIRRELPSSETEELRGGWPGDARPREIRADAVAVLPFENLSPDADNEYFSDGLTEDITTSIAHVRGLCVVSRASVLQYKDRHPPLDVIARHLGVATVVTGSVRKSGGRIRVVAQVVDTASGEHLWAETYDRSLEDVFQVQTDVATHVANAVRRELSPDARDRIRLRGTSDPQAYDLLLRARFLWNLRSETAVSDSVEVFRKAAERDPAFALAHVGLADAYTVLGIYGARSPREVFPAAKEAAAKALSLDPRLGEALASQACVTAVYDWDWGEAERGFRRAIKLSPSYPTARQWYAMNVLAAQGRFEDALEALDGASAIDPVSFAVSVSRGIILFYARKHADAAAALEAVGEHHPRYALLHVFLAQCHAAEGRLDEALTHARRAAQLSDRSPESVAALGYVLGLAGETEEAEDALSRLAAISDRRYVSRVLPAQVQAGLGRRDDALASLECAVEERATDLIWLGVRPMYDGLRGEARFAALLERMGLAGT